MLVVTDPAAMGRIFAFEAFRLCSSLSKHTNHCPPCTSVQSLPRAYHPLNPSYINNYWHHRDSHDPMSLLLFNSGPCILTGAGGGAVAASLTMSQASASRSSTSANFLYNQPTSGSECAMAALCGACEAPASLSDSSGFPAAFQRASHEACLQCLKLSFRCLPEHKRNMSSMLEGSTDGKWHSP